MPWPEFVQPEPWYRDGNDIVKMEDPNVAGHAEFWERRALEKLAGMDDGQQALPGFDPFREE